MTLMLEFLTRDTMPTSEQKLFGHQNKVADEQLLYSVRLKWKLETVKRNQKCHCKTVLKLFNDIFSNFFSSFERCAWWEGPD